MTTSTDGPVRPVGPGAVTTVGRLLADGVTGSEVRAQIAAARWRRFGNAVVRHNGPLSERQRHAVALTNAGPRSLLTALTALEMLGLRHWHRDDVHVLVPAGARVRRVAAVPIAVHSVVRWPPPTAQGRPDLHHPAHAAVLAASAMKRVRVGVALLAACVQQGLVTAAQLDAVVGPSTNLRHRAMLISAIGDIGMGAQALSEIDFALLCRRAGLIEPIRQAVRVEPSGRRRYLDAEWVRADGRRVVAEIDGALHLLPGNWWDDQFRQNEVTLGRSIVLRFPTVAVRERDPRVVDQLRRAGVPATRGRSSDAEMSL